MQNFFRGEGDHLPRFAIDHDEKILGRRALLLHRQARPSPGNHQWERLCRDRARPRQKIEMARRKSASPIAPSKCMLCRLWYVHKLQGPQLKIRYTALKLARTHDGASPALLHLEKGLTHYGLLCHAQQ